MESSEFAFSGSTPPDVEAMQEITDKTKLHDLIHDDGWKLLGILYSRIVDEKGSFRDKATFIIGLPRHAGRK
ncbi:MAG TPA: hypothetical protein VGO67_01735 [Verrucomicrobiae bacterium]|jgi:hypothetical protein